MNLNYDQFNGDALIFKYNLDEYGNPISIKVDKEEKQVSVHGTIQLEYVPDEYNRVIILNENNTQMTEVFNRDEIMPNTYYIDYNNGVAYLDKSQFGKTKIYNYYKKGIQLIGCSRIYDEHDVTGKHVVLTLQEIIDAGKEALRFLLDIGDAKKVIELLESLIAEGNLTITNLENKKNECIQAIDDAISQATQDKNEIVEEIQENIQEALDSVINVAGNKEAIIKSSQWALNGDVYEKEIAHDLNSENLHLTAKNSDTKEACTIGYKILDKTRILLKSDEAINMSVVLSASYYHATQTINDNIAEEVVKARKGELDLKTKIDSIDNCIVKVNEQLEQIEKQLIKNEFYVARHKNLMRLYNNISKFKGLVGGDSIMAGAGSTNFNARFDWQLATYLQANIHGNTVSDYLPVNIAVGGTSINQIIHSLGVMVDNKGIPLKSVTKTSYWIIGTGRNDTTNKDVNSYCKKLREICSQANKLKVDLFIVTAPPKFSNGNVVDGYTGDENYLEIKRNMIRIASEFDVSIIDFHSYMMNRLKTESIRNLYYSDDVHLNDNGQLLLANLVGECMLHESFSDSFNSNFDGDNGRYIMTYLEPSYVNGAIKETLESIPENMVLAHTGIKAAYKIPAGSSVAFPVPQFLNDSTIYIGTLSQLTTGKYNVTSWTTGNIALNQATPQQHNSQYEYVNCIRTIPNVIQGAIQIEAVDGDVYLTGITCISSKLTYKSLTDGFALSGDWKKTYLGVEKQYYKSSTIGNSFSFEFFGTGFSLNLPTDSTGCLCNILIDNEISIDKSLVTVSAGLNNETTVGNLKQGYHKVTVSIKSTGSNGGSDCYIGEWLKVYNNYQNGEYVKSYTSVDVYNEMINYDFIEDEFTNSEHYITFNGSKLINMISI